jgi:hypothetical protein
LKFGGNGDQGIVSQFLVFSVCIQQVEMTLFLPKTWALGASDFFCFLEFANSNEKYRLSEVYVLSRFTLFTLYFLHLDVPTHSKHHHKLDFSFKLIFVTPPLLDQKVCLFFGFLTSFSRINKDSKGVA